MPTRTTIAAGSLALLLFGSLSGTLGYALYLRSGAYLRESERKLAAYLDLPVRLGGVTPRSLRARQYDQIVVYLPDGQTLALECRRAVLRLTPTRESPEAYELALSGGRCELSARTWFRREYRRALESGLRPSFDAGGPSRIEFADMDVALVREPLRLALYDAGGVIAFETAATAHAAALCRNLNGHVVRDDVRLFARFSPRGSGAVRVDQAELIVPRLPLASLRASNGPEPSGEFEGRITYSELDEQRVTRIAGSCYGVNLADWTAGVTPVTWSGRCNALEVVECRFRDQTLDRLVLRGNLADARLADPLASLGFADLGGDLTLDLGWLEFSRASGIERLIAAGRCTNLSLEALTRQLGWGEMTGMLRVVISDLEIRDNRVSRFVADIRIDDQSAGPHRVSGQLIRELVSRVLKINLPPFLPESVEFSRLGFRLDVQDEILHVFGSHGPREKTILTARLFGRDVPLITEPEQSFDLAPWLDQVRKQLLTTTQPVSQPSTATAVVR
ncbi:MAG: hypothetical protein CHACPFDD_00336 [Phycisphaerae bacterium]|nr:hypothetical protein [Phycisphaerae bacterium]